MPLRAKQAIVSGPDPEQESQLREKRIARSLGRREAHRASMSRIDLQAHPERSPANRSVQDTLDGESMGRTTGRA